MLNVSSDCIPMSKDADVIVIGAGPAGLSAAKILSEANVDFLLLSKEDTPCENKPCGGFVPVKALHEFNLGQFDGSYPISTIRMKFPGLEMKQVDFDEIVGVNATRKDLGQAQLGKIGKREQIRLRTKVNHVHIGEEGCTLSYTHDNEKGSATSNVVIDASGANPVSLRFLDFRNRIPNSQMGYAVQYQMISPPGAETLPGLVDFYYGGEYSPGGYAWSFTRSDSAAVGTGGIISRVRQSETRVADYLHKLVSEVEPARSLLEGMTVEKVEAALMPLAGIMRPSFTQRLLLAGDAAGHCSPITGEGIHYSMIAGKMAAETVMGAIQSNDFSSKRLSEYESKWLNAFGSDLKWGLWLQRRFLNGESGSLGSGFLNSEKSRRIIAEMLLGMRSVKGAILRAIPGYLRSRL